MVENASQYKASGLVSTGLCWNAGGIAAAIILVAAFAGSQWKVVALISSILTQSSTMIVGVGIVILFFLFQYLFSKRLKNNKIGIGNLFIDMTFIGLIVMLLVFVSKIQDMFNKVMQRR